MKLILASLFASAVATAAALPHPATLIDQTVAQTQAQNVAERYAAAGIPRQQAALEPTREEEYRRIQEDMQNWFPHRSRKTTKRDFKLQWHAASAPQPQ